MYIFLLESWVERLPRTLRDLFLVGCLGTQSSHCGVYSPSLQTDRTEPAFWVYRIIDVWLLRMKQLTLSLEGLLQLSSLPFFLAIQLQSGWIGCCWVRLFIWGVVVLTTVRSVVRKWCLELAWYSEIVDIDIDSAAFRLARHLSCHLLVHLISILE